mmetsp:Transcript_10044/g.27501  ORF Transcript_10044/g.27501 Transcript_10044/m.27501 type:complete len:682 (-) Transcript_10044:172-2217(-)|eukprot:CAMPEP_0198109866 /NCGR_PEP_ID=MMETSP1442-20131203/1914_1 /TAXON_ID= /ORGANISM="Craspedostauros australis, Strain CCMP3328" /LENGTH=681 /DNA_ID=CAMNT_0043765697 /DNA_START=129 /DNA_END=2174 /DNA_ORIENTATION=-
MVKVPQGKLGYAVNGVVVFRPKPHVLVPKDEFRTRFTKYRKGTIGVRRTPKGKKKTASSRPYGNVRAQNEMFRILKFHPKMVDLRIASKTGNLQLANETLESIQHNTEGISLPLQTFITRLGLLDQSYAHFRTRVRILFTPDLENRTAIYYASLCGQQRSVKAYLALLVAARLCRHSSKGVSMMFQSGKRTFLEWLLRLDFRGASQFDEEQLHLCVLSGLNQEIRNIFIKNRYSLKDIIGFTGPFAIPSVFQSYCLPNSKHTSTSMKKQRKKRPQLVFDDSFHYSHACGYEMYDLDEMDEEDYDEDRYENYDGGDQVGHSHHLESETFAADSRADRTLLDEVDSATATFINGGDHADEIQALVDEIEAKELEEAIELSTQDSVNAMDAGDGDDDSDSDFVLEFFDDHNAIVSEFFDMEIIQDDEQSTQTATPRAASTNNERLSQLQASVSDSYSVVSVDDSWADASAMTGISNTSSWQIDGMSATCDASIVSKPASMRSNHTQDIDIVPDDQGIGQMEQAPPSTAAAPATPKPFSYRDALLSRKKAPAISDHESDTSSYISAVKVEHPDVISVSSAIEEDMKTIPSKVKGGNSAGAGRSDASIMSVGYESFGPDCGFDDDLEFDAEAMRDAAKNSAGGKLGRRYKSEGRTPWAPSGQSLRTYLNHRQRLPRKQGKRVRMVG